MKKKLCYVYSDLETSHLIEATADFIDKDRYDVTHVFLGAKIPALFDIFERKGYRVEFFEYHGKKDLPKAVRQLRRLFGALKPDIVHAHLFHATMAGLIAARLKGVKQRVHTRHHSMEHHNYHRHAVYYDKLHNYLSTDIIAVTEIVAEVLIKLDKANSEKVSVVRHGFDLNLFDRALSSETDLKPKYDLTDYYPIIGVVSRQMHGKGIQYIIPAFKRILAEYPKAKLVLANAVGSYRAQVEELLSEVNAANYKFIEFEKDVFNLYKTFDVFVHAPITRDYEAFGQIYIEALAMRIPSIFTLSGVANDFIENEFNALVVPFCDDRAIERAIRRLLNDAKLRQSLIENGEKSVKETFHVSRMIEGLNRVYL